MQRFGFVGLPNAGKSSLFNALAGGGAYAAPYAFATTDANVGVAGVPDHRLDRLSELSGSRRTTPAAVQFIDIGGLVEGASRGDGLGNAFLGHIRNTDALVYVLRAFEHDGVPGAGDDPLGQLRLLETELALADLQSVERQLEKRARAAKGDKSQRAAVELLARAEEVLQAGAPLYRTGLGSADSEGLRPFFLLTNKPVLAVVNIGEDLIDGRGAAAAVAAPVAAELGGAEVMPLCVQLEAEAAQLDPSERPQMLEALGLGGGALSRFLAGAYHLLGLRTFFTTEAKETRARAFRRGAIAAECAGFVHSDFQRGFIRADAIGWEQLVAAGSWSAARERGLVRSEGRAYPVVDGDVLWFRFNV